MAVAWRWQLASRRRQLQNAC